MICRPHYHRNLDIMMILNPDDYQEQSCNGRMSRAIAQNRRIAGNTNNLRHDFHRHHHHRQHNRHRHHHQYHHIHHYHYCVHSIANYGLFSFILSSGKYFFLFWADVLLFLDGKYGNPSFI